MSLVNDMLRDLEARRASPAERERCGDLHAVDETGAARRQRLQRLRLGLFAGGAVMGLAALAWLAGEGRFAAPPAPVAAPAAPSVELPPAQPAAVPAARLLDVLPQHDGRRLVLQLLLDRSVGYQRIDQAGSVSLRLDAVQLVGEPRQGRLERDGRSLSWQVAAMDGQVQVQLTGPAERLEVRDRLEPAGDRWQLWLEVPLDAAEPEVAEALQDLTPAEAEEEPLPDWLTREVPAAGDPAAGEPAPEPAPVESIPTPAAPAELRIASHQPDPLARARQALAEQQYPRAISEFEALHRARPDDPEVARWLARAYLAGGETGRLLAWLPAQLAKRPFDAELRMLLARGQLSAGDAAAAVATLRQQPPEPSRDPAYHALLAALHQQVGDWAASAALYRRLLALRPEQASWQLGLAIALEQLDQSALAVRHYRLALQQPGLDDSARRFAGERAAALGGRP